RLAEFENTIGEFVHLHLDTLNSRIPPAAGGRALLRAQMAAMRPSSADLGWRQRIGGVFLSRVGAYSGVAALLLLVSVGFWHGHKSQPGTRSEAKVEIAPNRMLTPGSVHPVRLSDVCSLGHSEKNRDVSVTMRQAVFDKYGLSGARAADYE